MDWHRKNATVHILVKNAMELSTNKINASMLAAKGFASVFICSSITAKLRTTSNNIFVDATLHFH
eukprot:11185128-Ditylum_brightwellii.AAC.1